MSERFEIVTSEASHWWRTHTVSGALLDRLMWLFIIGSVYLVVAKSYLLISLLLLLGMIPYGLLLRYLARRSLKGVIALHPELIEEFESIGVLSSSEANRPGDYLAQDI